MRFAMNSPQVRTLCAVLVAGAAASGCAAHLRVYDAPQAAVPAAWTQTAPVATESEGERLADWWNAFSDAQLSDLIARGVGASLDARTAVSRVREARASMRSVRSGARPQVDASASGRASQTGDAPGASGVNQSYGLGLDASWELDVFGAVRSATAGAAATVEARVEDLRDVLVSLAAEVALGYIDLRSFQQRLALAQSNVALQEETLELTRFRQQAGLGTDLEVQQALSNVESTRAQVALLEQQAAQAIHALSVLLAQPPGSLAGELGTAAPIPVAPIAIAAGVPADAIRRRPDVRSAERQLAAQFQQVNAARADLYPTFRLAGSIGLEALSIGRLVLPGSFAWSAGPSASTRLFNRDQLRQNVVIQSERQQQAVLTYESRVLGALQDVEDSLTALAQEQVRRDHLTAAASAAQQAAELSLQLYTAGLRDFRDVLDAQRSLLTLQDSMASSTSLVATDMVRLYKALGGGWRTESMLPAEARAALAP
jgi:NodT family efflux transporter outer membrane factor (OMF) lipoprotein